jgi:ComF family protein
VSPNLTAAISRSLAELTELVLPAACVCCSCPAPDGWCARCRPEADVRSTVHRLGFPVLSAGSYADELRTVILHYKERRNRRLAIPLAGLLAEVLAELREQTPAATLILVPVPSSHSAARQRGGDHVLRLTRLAAGAGDTVAPVLQVRAAAADSAGLSASERERNLHGHLRACPPRSGRSARVVLVDDIATTGTTLTECARALSAAGWSVSGAAVLAETIMRSTNSRFRTISTGHTGT